MPSRSNPNVPTSRKPKSARTLKTKRQNTQRLARGKARGTAAPRTSQAIRKAAPVSNKKARKLETKKLHARNRALDEALEAGEVEMKDVDAVEKAVKGEGKGKGTGKGKGGKEAEEVGGEGEEMVVDDGPV